MVIKQTVFSIGGMTCVNCENKIEQQLKQRKGVKDATVSYNKGTAVVTFDREEINEEQMIQVIEQLDYKKSLIKRIHGIKSLELEFYYLLSLF